MEHNLKISVSKKAKSDGILSCRSISVRERILCFSSEENRNSQFLYPVTT